jgi:hypothetical protein
MAIVGDSEAGWAEWAADAEGEPPFVQAAVARLDRQMTASITRVVLDLIPMSPSPSVASPTSRRRKSSPPHPVTRASVLEGSSASQGRRELIDSAGFAAKTATRATIVRRSAVSKTFTEGFATVDLVEARSGAAPGPGQIVFLPNDDPGPQPDEPFQEILVGPIVERSDGLRVESESVCGGVCGSGAV